MDEKLKKEIGERFLLFRKDQNLTQHKLGESLGFSQSKIKDLEKGQRGITEETAIILIRKYQLSLDWLYSGTGTMYNPFLVLPENETEVLKTLVSKFMK